MGTVMPTRCADAGNLQGADVRTVLWQAGAMLSLVVVAVLGTSSVEMFRDQGQFFIRAGSSAGIKVGAQLPILGDVIASTTERRTVGRATVLEVWPELARVSIDVPFDTYSEVPDGRAVALVRIPDPKVEPVVETHYGSFALDPLGFLTFGPTVNLELGAGRITGTAYFRWFGAGLLSNVLILGEGERYDFSFGLGLMMRFYFSPGFQGAHVGLGAEWIRGVVRNSDFLLLITSNYLVPQVEGGYRWGGGRFFVDLSGGVGFSARLFWKTENLPGGTLAAEVVPPAVASFFFSAKLGLGVYF
jgi:hypothetical protein